MGDIERVTKSAAISQEIKQIAGVYVFNSNMETDLRGSLSAFTFQEDQPRIMQQLNVVRSKPGVLRGIHAHATYDEFYIPIDGEFYFVLADARKDSPTFGNQLEFHLNAEDLIGFRVPVGVAHGALFISRGTLAYGISEIWSGLGEFGCRWDDPSLTFKWPVQAPILSEKDSKAGSYELLVKELNDSVLLK